MRTKDRVRQYRAEHPSSTVREIQHALNISSPSVVQYHLAVGSWVDHVQELEAAIRMMRTPFASTLTHEEALHRLREINNLTYAAMWRGRYEGARAAVAPKASDTPPALPDARQPPTPGHEEQISPASTS